MTASTTYPTIRNQWVSVLQALTPAFRTGTEFELFTSMPPEMTFEEWCAENTTACLRKFHVRRSGGREPPLANDADVVQLKANAELVVAYPKAYAEYNRSDARREVIDLEDVLDADGEQINNSIGICGAANYVSGQSICTAEQHVEEEAQVVFLVFDLEAVYYEDVTLTEVDALQNSSEQSFKHTVVADADSFTIPIPYQMADTSYVVTPPAVIFIPAGGASADIVPLEAGRTRNSFAVSCGGTLLQDTILDCFVRDA